MQVDVSHFVWLKIQPCEQVRVYLLFSSISNHVISLSVSALTLFAAVDEKTTTDGSPSFLESVIFI